MNYQTLVKRLSRKTGIPVSDVKILFTALLQVIEQAAEAKEDIMIENIGRLEFREYKAKRVANNNMQPWIKTDVLKQQHYHAFFKLSQNVQAAAAKKKDNARQAISKAGAKIDPLHEDTGSVFK